LLHLSAAEQARIANVKLQRAAARAAKELLQQQEKEQEKQEKRQEQEQEGEQQEKQKPDQKQPQHINTNSNTNNNSPKNEIQQNAKLAQLQSDGLLPAHSSLGVAHDHINQADHHHLQLLQLHSPHTLFPPLSNVFDYHQQPQHQQQQQQQQSLASQNHHNHHHHNHHHHNHHHHHEWMRCLVYRDLWQRGYSLSSGVYHYRQQLLSL
jgi:hypothetical protein